MIIIRNTTFIIIKKVDGSKLKRARRLELNKVIESKDQNQAFNDLAKKGNFRKKDLLYLFYASCFKQEIETDELTSLQKKVLAKLKKFALSNRDLYHIYNAYMYDTINSAKQEKILDIIQGLTK